MTLQDFIHQLELGAGHRFLNRSIRLVLCVLAVLVVLFGYDLRAFRNFSTQEAMDSSQLAHNLAQGKGYTTQFIRPLSIYLLQTQQPHNTQNAAPGRGDDPARLRANHPDLANPPVYPLLLAGLMKVLPFSYAIPSPERPKKFWSVDKKFYRYQPDFLIALFNEGLFFVMVVCAFFLAKRLFDAPVAWLSGAILLGTELFWRFSVSGLSTILLMLIFLGLVWCLVLLEEEAREPKWGRFGIYLVALVTGALAGLGGLTRYSFCWLIIPALLFSLAYTGNRRSALGATMLAGFLIVLTPWLVRNFNLSGMPFGTSTFAIIENSWIAPEDHLERSLEPQLLKPVHNSFPFLTAASRVFSQKLISNSRAILQSDLPKLGGTWVSAFFMVGLLVGFRTARLGRLRLFVLACIVLLTITQALGRTRLTDDSPEINSENLLVIVAPMVVIYGVSLFFVMLQQVAFPFLQLRAVAIGLFGLIVCLPLFLTILPPRANPIVFPPYYPPSIQTAVGWTKEDELLMSDVPWAVAWYGQSQCIWLTSNARVDFYRVNDYLKPISALYLTPQTVDRWTQSGDWGNLFVRTMPLLSGDNSKYPLKVNLTLPLGTGEGITFPLHYLQAGWPMQLLFTYREHWPSSP